MTYESERYDPINVPQDIVEAAMKVHNWMARQGTYSWELMNICSRNHAWELRSYKDVMILVKNICQNCEVINMSTTIEKIKALHTDKKMLLVTNCDMPVEDIEKITESWKTTKQAMSQ